MPLGFWIRRFCFILVCAAVPLSMLYMLRGQSPRRAAGEAVLWGAIAATIVIVTRLVRLRRGQRCEVCRDSPDQQ